MEMEVKAARRVVAQAVAVIQVIQVIARALSQAREVRKKENSIQITPKMQLRSRSENKPDKS